MATTDRGNPNPNLSCIGFMLSSMSAFTTKLKKFLQKISGHHQAEEYHALASEATDSRGANLQHDLMPNILSRLPARSLVRFRCVCKRWNSLFQDSHFISKQLNHASKNPTTFFCYLPSHHGRADEAAFCSFKVKVNKVKANKARVKANKANKFVVPLKTITHRISNPCNGLVAFHGGHNAYLANPCTREWTALPEVSSQIPGVATQLTTRYFLGLGFCMTTGKYKLVRYVYHGPNHGLAGCFCEVLTVGIDRSWRSLGEMPRRVTEFWPAYGNGCIYWTVDAAKANGCYTSPDLVLSFDVCQEKFATIRIPQCDPEPYGAYRHLCMSILEGSVCLIDWRVHLDSERFCYLPVMNIYVLKNHEDSIWTKSHSLRLRSVKLGPKAGWNRGPAANNMFPVEIKNGKLLLYRPIHKWRLHNLRTGACSTIRPPPLKFWWNRVYPFVCAESIIPIDRLPEDRPTPTA